MLAHGSKLSTHLRHVAVVSGSLGSGCLLTLEKSPVHPIKVCWWYVQTIGWMDGWMDISYAIIIIALMPNLWSSTSCKL